MAIAYINVVHVSRGEGRSAVGAAAYAARMCLTDERTGEVYDYSRKSDDLKASGVYLPKGAPERFRDRAVLWNEAEQAEKRKDARTGRRLIIALPHELTEKQQQQLLTDFIREQFTRKGLAVDMNIHGPDAKGDDRNDHAHLLITTRFIDASGLTAKDRESNEKAALERWQANWEKAVNRQLERYGHAVRISFKTPEGQQAQIHLGQAAAALERKGVKTRAGDQLREIISSNEEARSIAAEQARSVANEQTRTVGKEVVPEASTAPQEQEAITRPGAIPKRSQQQPESGARADRIAAEDAERRKAVAPFPKRRAVNDNSRRVAARIKWEAERAEKAAKRLAQRFAEKVDRVEARLGMTRADMQTRQITESGAFQDKAQRERLALERYLDDHYSDHAQDLAREIEVLSQQKGRFPKLWARLTGKAKTEAERLAEAQQSLENIEMRKAERQEILSREQQIIEAELAARHQAEIQSLEAKPDYQELTEWVENYRADLGRMAARKEARQERERGGPEIDGPELKP